MSPRPQQEIRALKREGKELRLVNESLRKEIESLKESSRKIPARPKPAPEKSGTSSNQFIFFGASVFVFVVGIILGKLL